MIIKFKALFQFVILQDKQIGGDPPDMHLCCKCKIRDCHCQTNI